MSDGQKLFLILLLLYGYDCLAWIGRRTVLFASASLDRWRAKFATDFFGNIHGSVAILNPLPFLAPSYLAHWSPVSVSPEGICSFAAEAFPADDATPAVALKFEEIEKAGRDGKHLIVNGSRFATCGSEDEAGAIIDLIRRLVSAPKDDREKIIRTGLDRQFNRTRAARTLRLVKPRANTLRWAGSALFVFLYIVAPVASYVYGVTNLVIPAGIVMFVSAWAIALMYYRADRALHRTRVSERVANIMNMCLCAPAAIRAADFLTLRSMNRFHPLVVGDVLLGGYNVAFARTIIRHLKYPGHRDVENADAVRMIEWQRNLQIEACATFVQKQYNLSAEELLVAPEWDGSSAAYCPRCLGQYPEAGECMDCAGIQLIPFDAAQKTEAIHEP